MISKIIKASETDEFYTEEGCFIKELSNSTDNKELSIALVRVEQGVTTEWHALKNTSERYLIFNGKGLVELEGIPAKEVSAGDVVEIPADCYQRITNTGNSDLQFYAVCTPRFRPENYLSG